MVRCPRNAIHAERMIMYERILLGNEVMESVAYVPGWFFTTSTTQIQMRLVQYHKQTYEHAQMR